LAHREFTRITIELTILPEKAEENPEISTPHNVVTDNSS